MHTSRRTLSARSRTRLRGEQTALPFLTILSLLLAAPAGATPVGPQASARVGAEYAKGRLLVRLAPGFTPESAGLGELRRAAGAPTSRPVFEGPGAPARDAVGALGRWYDLEVDPATDIRALAATWASRPGIEVAQPDFLSTLDSAPNDPMYAGQWGHRNVGQMPAWCELCDDHQGGVPVGTPGFDADVEGAWDVLGNYGHGNVLIGVIDNGADMNHPDLDLVVGYDFDDGDPNPGSTSGHGTGVAGIACALANNGIGGAGVAPGCRVLVIRSGKKSSERAASLVFAADYGAAVVNMSWTIYGEDSDPVLEDALDYAAAADLVLVSTSGNRNESEVWLPQSHPDVLCVGAASPCGDRKRSSSDPEVQETPDHEPDPNGVTCDGEYWWGSAYGSGTQDAGDAVDLLAPIILPTADYNDDYQWYFSGTSCASPFVAGVAALVRSYHPEWTAAQVRTALTSTAADVVNVESSPGWDRYSGYGLVNAAAAVSYGSPPVAAPEPVVAVAGAVLRIVGPNPLRTETRFDWSVARSGAVAITVFDAAGRRVRGLVESNADPGVHVAVWDGRDAAGRAVSDGVYFIALRTDDTIVSRRVLVLR